ncbi:MAG: 23S rRNA (adenine(2503)-C(2))-methyltransferase RlmN [Desulfobacteraceae bacterium]|jgi:23S rRNA (adenine2503-C2)-methyltransferase|nr:23S rRNA (adenine(2503)-C(2))-methyltransferase RlmN [Desulfobacteraceae bacterium]
MPNDPLPIIELTFPELTVELHRRYGRGAYHAAAILRAVYRQGLDPLQTPEVKSSPRLAAALARDLALDPGTVVDVKTSSGVVKFITRLCDHETIESVVLPMATHLTVCVSTQAGCRMGCRFCETARMGWRRHLRVEEIVGQVVAARRRFGDGVRNVVFMGMGEPLDNFDNVVQAVRVITDQRGLDVAMRRVTVSTCGLDDGIRRLAALNWPHLKLAVSLNAPNDRLRDELMPVNRRVPLARLMEVLGAFPLAKDAALMMAYVLVPGVNDRPAHARQVASLLAPLKARINLIGFNPLCGEGGYRAPQEVEIEAFARRLAEAGVFVCRRRTKGQDLAAACGQLRSQRLG